MTIARAIHPKLAVRPSRHPNLTSSEKAAWFNAYRDVVLTPDGVAGLTRVWKREQAIPGLTLAEPDEIALAMELAVREAPGWDEVLKNHPLREEHARRFVRPALDLLREIQQTGDIFFPTRWMDSTLSGHRSPEAAKTVREFLASNPQYPQRLTWTILASADELFRIAGM